MIILSNSSGAVDIYLNESQDGSKYLDQRSDNRNPNITDLYREISIIGPCMCFLSLLAFIGNCYILLCVPWIRRRSMNANLKWSLSLAAADAWAAALIMIGLTFNSYLPHVWGFAYNPCVMVTLEIFRVGGMLTSVFHLLALSLNHYASIVSPLKYKLMMTSARSRAIIGIMWILPTLIICLCFSVVPDQGFNSENCLKSAFYFQIIFRIPVFALFNVPMIILLIVYGKILRILYRTRKNAENPPPGSKVANNLQPRSEDRSEDSSKDSPLVLRKISSSQQSQGGGSLSRISKLQNRMKAVITTLLIVGTFGLGWLPSVIFFMVYCLNCAVTFVEPRPKFYINAAVNSLIIFKLLLNPLIYGFRITEIRYALWSMHKGKCRRFNVPLSEIPTQFRALSNVYSSRNTNGRSQNTKNEKDRKNMMGEKLEMLNNN